MTLNLFTPLFRINNLHKVYESIPKHDDIHWIIVTCESNNFNLSQYERTPNITIVKLKTHEGFENVHLKVNAALKHLRPGFFMGLDDDTTFNHNTYEAFKKYGNDYDMIVGQQKLPDGGIRIAQKPLHCHTDGAQGIISTKLLEGVEFRSFANDPTADCNFLLDCWNKTDNHLLLHEVTTNYNFLR